MRGMGGGGVVYAVVALAVVEGNVVVLRITGRRKTLKKNSLIFKDM